MRAHTSNARIPERSGYGALQENTRHQSSQKRNSFLTMQMPSKKTANNIIILETIPPARFRLRLRIRIHHDSFLKMLNNQPRPQTSSRKAKEQSCLLFLRSQKPAGQGQDSTNSGSPADDEHTHVVRPHQPLSQKWHQIQNLSMENVMMLYLNRHSEKSLSLSCQPAIRSIHDRLLSLIPVPTNKDLLLLKTWAV